MSPERFLAKELRAYRHDLDPLHFERIASRLPLPGGPADGAIVRSMHQHPEESLRFLESAAGAPWRARLEGTPVDTHWPPVERLAVSYHLLARGNDSDSVLGWSPFRVERPRPDIAEPAGGVPVPIPVRKGHRTSFRAGEGVLSAPDVRWLTLDDAIVQDGGSVRVGDTWIAYEPSADPSNATFVSGLWQTHWGTRVHPDTVMIKTAPEAPDVIDEGILIAGRNDDNWYQFMVFYLARILSVPSSVPSDAPLLVTERTLPGGIEALRELSDRPIRMIDPGLAQRVRRLHVGPPVGNMRDDGYDAWFRALTVHLPALRELRRRWGVDTPRIGAGRKIFLHRNAGRRGVTNAESIASIAQEAGLELVDPALLTFGEQREVFSSSELVVGATGAVMANYLLMRPGSHIIGLTSDHLYDFISPPAMAWIAGCTFEYVTGPSLVTRRDVEHLQHWVQADFAIPAQTFRRVLRARTRS
ncbi:glycosyltransferase family 61 protein [Protaetiibacter intestinalis]|nr:glycosyltransferase 61 family protein [Protaetiibacter intestinalis]